jgi:methyltransferase (TIGR00027 family)
VRTEAPSTTARKVALNIVSLGTRKHLTEVLPPGIVEATADLLVAGGVVGPRTLRFARSWLADGIYRSLDWLMPGQFEAFAHRKAFCERQARKGIEAGARQVLVLGAGYDTLGWRLAPEFEDVDFFEIDHLATATIKARGIEAMGSRPNHHLMAEDLGRRGLVEVLQDAEAWIGGAPSVIIAEGLLMYLSPAAVGDLLRQCAEVTGPGSRLAFTYLGTRPDGRPDAGPWTWLWLRSLESSGEPWLWSIRPAELDSFLRDHGWTLDRGQTIGSARRGVEFFGLAVDSPHGESAARRRRRGEGIENASDRERAGADRAKARARTRRKEWT